MAPSAVTVFDCGEEGWATPEFSDGESDYLDILTLYPAYVAVANGDGSHLIKSFKFVFCSLEGTCIQ